MSEILSLNLDANACLEDCSNNGECKLNEENKFLCECNKDFIGSKCEVNSRPCSSKPCFNNGTCVEDLSNNTFYCTCDQFYFGSRCENKINICQNETCSNRGICIDFNNKPLCECFFLIKGEKCEIETSEKILVKNVTKTSSILAIFLISLFYACIFLNDFLNLLKFTFTFIIKF